MAHSSARDDEDDVSLEPLEVEDALDALLKVQPTDDDAPDADSLLRSIDAAITGDPEFRDSLEQTDGFVTHEEVKARRRASGN